MKCVETCTGNETWAMEYTFCGTCLIRQTLTYNISLKRTLYGETFCWVASKVGVDQFKVKI